MSRIEPAPLLETAFGTWWIATVTSTAAWMVGVGRNVGDAAGLLKYSWVALIAGGWFLFCYFIGVLVDRSTRGRFSEGYAPFAAPWGLVVWRTTTLVLVFVATLEAGRHFLQSEPTVLRAIVGTLLAGAVALAVAVATGAGLDIVTARKFSRGGFPFNFLPRA